jgi:hypothetical protein
MRSCRKRPPRFVKLPDRGASFLRRKVTSLATCRNEVFEMRSLVAYFLRQMRLSSDKQRALRPEDRGRTCNEPAEAAP